MKILVYCMMLISLSSAITIKSDDYCEQCCKQGRWTSKECCIRCNNCEGYSDEARSECGDLPS